MIDLPILPIDDKMADKIQALSKSEKDRRLRIKEQHLSILELDVYLSDEPLIPTTKEMLNEYVEQELLKEIKKEFMVIISGK